MERLRTGPVSTPLLQSGDFHDLRIELLETAVPFYEEFVRQDHEDPELELERGLACIRDTIGEALD